VLFARIAENLSKF